MKKQDIPTPEEFVRASAKMQKRDEYLSKIEAEGRELFKEVYSIDDLFLMSQQENEYRVFTFFLEHNNLSKIEVKKDLESFFTESIRQYKGKEAIIKFEYDTKENVHKIYGNYLNRMR